MITTELVNTIFCRDYTSKVPTTNILTAANGQHIEVYDTIKFFMKIGTEEFAIRAIVVSKLNEDMILGSYFISKLFL